MGMQSDIQKDDKAGFLIHTFKLKICPLECLPYDCTGKPYVCNVLCACAYALREKRGIPVTYYFDDLYPLCSEQHYSECACIVWLYHAYSYTVGPKKAINLAPLFKDIQKTFFFCMCVCVCVCVCACNWYAGSPSLVPLPVPCTYVVDDLYRICAYACALLRLAC